MNILKSICVTVTIWLFFVFRLWAGVGLTINPEGWDIGKGSSGTWVSQQVTVTNIGDEPGRVIIAGADTQNWSLGIDPGTNMLAIQFSIDGSNWSSITKDNLVLIGQLDAAQSVNMNFRYRSPSSISPTTLQDRQDMPLKITIQPFTPTGSWSLQTLDSVGDVGSDNSIFINKSNDIFVLYRNKSPWQLKLAKWNGTEWSQEVIEATVPTDTSIIVNDSGKIYGSYRHANNRTLNLVTWDNINGWIDSVVDASNVNFYGTSVALDSSGNPCITYSAASKIKFAKWTGSSWTTEAVDALGYGDFGSLKLDKDDNPHIAYYDFVNGDLKYAQKTNGTWVIQNIDSVGNVGSNCSLVLDGNDDPFIAYDDLTNKDLKLAHYNGASWEFVIVDAQDDTGYYSSLALDTTWNPHIAYYNSTNKSIKYASFSGGNWDIQTIDENINMATSAIPISLGLDTNNNPHIVYYDYGNGDLKYAGWK